MSEIFRASIKDTQKSLAAPAGVVDRTNVLPTVCLCKLSVSQEHFNLVEIFEKADIFQAHQLSKYCFFNMYYTRRYCTQWMCSQNAESLFRCSLISETKIGFIITDKILLQKCFTSDADKILYNVFGYLAASPTRIDLLNDTIQKLLSVWADPITIRYN